jgi:hypothetical protein
VTKPHLDVTMAALEDAVDMMGRLAVANTSRHDAQQDKAELRWDMSTIVRNAKKMIENVEKLIQQPYTSEYMDENLTALSNLITLTTRLMTITASIKDASENLVMAHVSSLSDQSSEVPEMLLYFEKELKAIIRGVLSGITAGEPKLLRILEECYKQAFDDLGALSCDRYSSNKDGLCLKTLYNSDFQSKQYYVLINVWSQALQTCPGGPTLFIHKEIRCSDDIPHTSRYLLRAFDSASSGLSDDTLTLDSIISTFSPSRREKPLEDCSSTLQKTYLVAQTPITSCLGVTHCSLSSNTPSGGQIREAGIHLEFKSAQSTRMNFPEDSSPEICG